MLPFIRGPVAPAWPPAVVRVPGVYGWKARSGLTIIVQGRQHQHLPRDVGDCVLLRADGLFAYQLAVVVDDADQGVDHVVRGADLIDSTPRQIYLQRLLGLPTPAYAHLPVAVDATGAKLSKQTLAAPLDARNPLPALFAAAAFLGQNPPPELCRSLCRPASADFWAWARRKLAVWTRCRPC